MPLVVIIDDRVTNRNIFAKLAALIEPNVSVHTFSEPALALVWLETHTPDLVLTDYKMPNMDGGEFIGRIRSQSRLADIPIVVITVYEERNFRLNALAAGATDFLQSPVDHQEFVTRARNLLKLRRQQLLLESRAQSLERDLARSERSRENVIRDSRERLAQVIDTIPAMISATDHGGRILFANAYFAEILGGDPSVLVGREAASLFTGEHGPRNRTLDRMIFETNRLLPSYEEEIFDRSGAPRVFLTAKSPLRDPSKGVIGVLTSSLDITDRKRAEAHLTHMAHHDPLTGLPNRILLRDRVRRAIARTRRGDKPFALHLVDLDGFKGINDLLGHSSGDKFLLAVAQRLRTVVKEGDTVARIGGDEFAILQAKIASTDEASHLAGRITDALVKPFSVAGEDFVSSGSIGVAVHPADGVDVEDLLRNADLAMYRAKGDGGNVHRFYVADMNTRARQSVMLDAELRKAIAEDQFLLYYQPQISLATGDIVGAEALLRWDRPGVGMVTPSSFLPRAEENGMIVPINEWVLNEACREAKRWQRSGLAALRVGVNLSPIQFRKQNVPLLVARVLADTGLDPRRLDLEITESIVMQDTDTVAAQLQQMRNLGVRISIDDFGTGYSSLSYVKNFPVDRLKVDQSFIRNLTMDANDAAILRAVISLAHSLKLSVVAEGVEHADQLAYLHGEGCDEVQGYYFAKPMRADDFIAYVRGEVALAKTA